MAPRTARPGPTREGRIIAEVVTGGRRSEARDLFGSEKTVRLVDSAAAVGDVVLVARVEGERDSWRQVGKTLACSGSARAGIYHIASRHRLRPLYPLDVLQEADGWVRDPGFDDPELDDLTRIGFITIDNPDSRDLDQALHIERGDRGRGFVIRYALADASYYVRPGTALFDEALARGASFYLPGLTVPMLPPILSEGLISLTQNELRRSLVFEMELDEDAICRRTRIRRALVQSVCKTSYRRVQRYFEDPGGSGWRGEPWRETLDLLREVGELRIAEARGRHVVQHHRAEVEVTFSERERLGFSILTDRRLDVERYNEQVSLLCNVEGALLMQAEGDQDHVQAIFRVHPAPLEGALDTLTELIDALVAEHGLDPDRWRWQRPEPLADYLERLPVHGRWGRVTRAIDRQARLLNERSTYEDRPAPHHGVGAPVYARFTAPMREIVGVFTHKEAFEALADPAAASLSARDEELRARVLRAGNRAKEVQRRLTKEANHLVLDRLFASEADRPADDRPCRPGTIMGMTASRLYVQLDDPALDVKVYVRDLEEQLGQQLAMRPSASAMEGGPHVFRIGDPITIIVAGQDQGRNRWRFHVLTAATEVV